MKEALAVAVQFVACLLLCEGPSRSLLQIAQSIRPVASEELASLPARS